LIPEVLAGDSALDPLSLIAITLALTRSPCVLKKGEIQRAVIATKQYLFALVVESAPLQREVYSTNAPALVSIFILYAVMAEWLETGSCHAIFT
jgi:hypothetical protein